FGFEENRAFEHLVRQFGGIDVHFNAQRGLLSGAIEELAHIGVLEREVLDVLTGHADLHGWRLRARRRLVAVFAIGGLCHACFSLRFSVFASRAGMPLIAILARVGWPGPLAKAHELAFDDGSVARARPARLAPRLVHPSLPVRTLDEAAHG